MYDINISAQLHNEHMAYLIGAGHGGAQDTLQKENKEQVQGMGAREQRHGVQHERGDVPLPIRRRVEFHCN